MNSTLFNQVAFHPCRAHRKNQTLCQSLVIRHNKLSPLTLLLSTMGGRNRFPLHPIGLITIAIALGHWARRLKNSFYLPFTIICLTSILFNSEIVMSPCTCWGVWFWASSIIAHCFIIERPLIKAMASMLIIFRLKSPSILSLIPL